MQTASVCIKAVCVHNLFNGKMWGYVLGAKGNPLIGMYIYSGGSRGVPWVTQNPPFCRFVRVHRQPHAHARAQSKTFWTAEPPFQNPRSTTGIYSEVYYTESLCLSFYAIIMCGERDKKLLNQRNAQ